MKTPYFLIDESSVLRNCEILARVSRETGCKVLLAQKAFSAYDCYPLISKFLDGTTASGFFEARLGKEKFGGETHVFAPAFTAVDMEGIAKIADHVVFNSKSQLLKHCEICKERGIQIGLRINPEIRTQESEIYDPCAPFSRFGMRVKDFEKDAGEIIAKIDGLHFHTLCEQGLDALETTLVAFEKKFGKYIKEHKNIKWVNFGGGHHITREGYDVDGLVGIINDFKLRYGVQVYLEPGEAVVLNSGTLHARILDIVRNEKDIAILDTSAACHNPDILQTQHEYIPSVVGAVKDSRGAGADGYRYRLAGNTCLAGDVIGDYIFAKRLVIGDEVIFEDMALYTMVQTNMFNGINLPSIYVKRLDGKVELLREFGFDDYKGRLGS